MNSTDVGRASRRQWRSRGAFSLVELAAVLSALTLLAGLLAPSLANARGKSRKAVCLQRLATIAATGRVYAVGDDSGFMIPIHPLQYTQTYDNMTYIGAYEWGGKSGIGRPGFTDGPPGAEFEWMTSKYGTKAGFGPATRPMNNLLYPHGFHDATHWGFDRAQAYSDTRLELPAYRCPSDTRAPRGAHCPDWLAHPQRSSYDQFGNSFAANVFMIGGSGGGWCFSNAPYLRPVSRIPNPARTIAYEENIGRWAWACRRETRDCTWLGQGVDPGPSGQLDGWHGKPWMYNRSFVDAHAESQAVYIDDTEDVDGYANHYRQEIVFEDVQTQSMYRCVIIRGPGWQKDTLPAPPIELDVNHSGVGRPAYEDCVNTTYRGAGSGAPSGGTGEEVSR